MASSGPFKTAEDQAAYVGGYSDILEELWPVPYAELFLESRFGSTHVVVSGPKDGPALVLFHGFNTTLVMWAANIADFAQSHRVYAIDTMGQPSRSLPDERLRTKDDLIEWVGVTLDALGLNRAPLVGMSTGAWIATTFAIARPERVSRLGLLSPAASFQPLVRQFMPRALLTGIIRTRSMMNSLMGWMGVDAGSPNINIRRLLDLMWLGGMYFKAVPERKVMPGVFTDAELASLRMPVLLIIGEQERIYNATKAVARARSLVGDLEAHLIPDSRHEMSMTRAAEVDPMVLDFLART